MNEEPDNRDPNLVNGCVPGVLFLLFGELLSNQRKLPDNLPFGFTVIHTTAVSKILEIQITMIFDEGSRAKDAFVTGRSYSEIVHFNLCLNGGCLFQ